MLLKIKFILPFYHTVSDELLIHCKHLFSLKTPKKFIRDLDFIGNHFQFISLEEFRKYSTTNFTDVRHKPVAHLTFDDGLKECSGIIAPILIKKGIPATFFINPSFMDNKDMLFRFKISIIIEAYKNANHLDRLAANQLINQNSKSGFISQLKSLRFNDGPLIDQAACRLNIDFAQYLDTHQPYMSKAEIDSLILNGFTVGGHSIDHPELRHLKIEEQKHQVKSCMDQIDQLFHPSIKAFAFPFTDFELTNELFNYIYSNRVIDLSFGTAGIKEDSIKNNFQRIPMEKWGDGKITLLYYYLKALMRHSIGKNQITRD